MKGKKYRIDKATGKLVSVSAPDNVIRLLKVEQPTNDWAESMVAVTGFVVPESIVPERLKSGKELSAEEMRHNVRQVLEAADREAEKFERRDCVRTQGVIEELRERFLG